MPEPEQLFATIDATWPAANYVDDGAFRFREGKGGGQRVSAATAIADASLEHIEAAEALMRSMGQRPLFMIRSGDSLLDTRLAHLGYETVDPVNFYLADTAAVARKPEKVTVFPSWPPLSAQTEIWALAGTKQARLDIMNRANGPKSSFLGRTREKPAGTAFAAIAGDIAMVHALEISSNERRRGLGRSIVQGAAHWAAHNGARWFSALVVKNNLPANSLYQSLGMTIVAGYHYRRAPG